MRVDFYQLSRDPVDVTVVKLAEKVLQAGQRLVVVAPDENVRERISKALWGHGDGRFLAHGSADGQHAARQPILIGDGCNAPNEARIALLADGRWRKEAEQFDRVLLLFDSEATMAARELWRELSAREDVDTHIHKQPAQGGWREGR